MKNQNYLLIQMDRYAVENSQINVVTEQFLDTWLEFNGNVCRISTAPIAVLDHEVTGWDSEEVTYLWLPTDRETTDEDQNFMTDFLMDVEDKKPDYEYYN